MSILQSIVLGLLQGIAEFLPISSSGHLAVAQNLFGLDEVPLLYDVLLHVATLAAVVIYFRKKIGKLFRVLGRWIFRRQKIQDGMEGKTLSQTENTEDSVKNTVSADSTDFLSGTEQRARRTILAVIVSTIVTAAIGILTSKLIPELSIKATCLGFLVTAALLIFSSLAEKKQSKKSTRNEPGGITLKQAVAIGVMQGFGTLPGISRSGSTIAGGQLSKLDRAAAGEYSFIISIPAILGAFVLGLKDYIELVKEGAENAVQTMNGVSTAAGCLVAFVSGYFALSFLMKLIKKGRLEWFSCYLIPLGVLGMIFLK